MYITNQHALYAYILCAGALGYLNYSVAPLVFLVLYRLYYAAVVFSLAPSMGTNPFPVVTSSYMQAFQNLYGPVIAALATPLVMKTTVTDQRILAAYVAIPMFIDQFINMHKLWSEDKDRGKYMLLSIVVHAVILAIVYFAATNWKMTVPSSPLSAIIAFVVFTSYYYDVFGIRKKLLVIK